MSMLDDIRERDAQYVFGLRTTGYDVAYHPEGECEADKDRHFLLGEVDRLERAQRMSPVSMHISELEALDRVLLERARIRAAIAGMPELSCSRYHEHTDQQPYPSGGISRAAALAAVDGPNHA